MPPPAESSGRRLAGRAVGAAVVVLMAIPAYLSVGPSWRPIAVRLACAVVVALGCARARNWVRDAVAPTTPSALDAPPPEPAAPELDPRFLRIRDDVRSSAWSRSYFDAILWPRLTALAGRDLPRPPERSRGMRWRGPSLGALETLIALIERRR